ncbi:MAG: 16S rRNA (cytosine(1402)-N(4))-methyltransferase RsmH [Methylovulum sp.]|nr:16S rRNA (cytosine(1402)-N(4))-methyltransferase RsmH [Methylovulum sp.]MCF7997904.1 16S rRNA (cytosine(1402)-N(4))-methyltransferase RsmH [Methylovulum sp.]
MNHLPVMYTEALQHLAIKKEGVYVDCTFGRGGHSSGILSQLGDFGRLLAMDRDADACTSEVALTLLTDPRFRLTQNCFSNLSAVIEQHACSGLIDGILIDLGVSSPQLDDPERGFSFMRAGPLDMRMDTSQGLSAAEWLARIDEATLVNVLFEYGEERFARRIARAILTQRELQAINTTNQLVKLIEDAIPVKEKHKHPATRSFQAIRIAINNELDELKHVLTQAISVLKPGGRLVVISFHSLEDRIVKRYFRAESGAKYDPGKLPIKEADIAKGVLKTISKAIKASDDEVVLNPRARSAVMRVAERV